MVSLTDLKVKIFADGANLETIEKLANIPIVKGFTTNPTLMRKAGVRDYQNFAMEVLSIVGNLPISFEVFSDEFDAMEQQAVEMASWGTNVYVKIPITNTAGISSAPLVGRLAAAGVQVNITAVFTEKQVEHLVPYLSPDCPCFISIFAGRIADTGVDPMPIVAGSLTLVESLPHCELIWASPRELLNIIQADTLGCHVITATSDLLDKLNSIGLSLDEFSLDTVRMFRKDAVEAGYRIDLQHTANK